MKKLAKGAGKLAAHSLFAWVAGAAFEAGSKAGKNMDLEKIRKGLATIPLRAMELAARRGLIEDPDL